MGECTPRSLFLNQALQTPVKGLAAHLAHKHQHDLDFAVAPYEGCVDDAEPLGHEREPCTEVRDAVRGVLQNVSWQHVVYVPPART
jgi:hypothetical protein